MPNLVEIAPVPVVLEKGFFNFVNVFSIFRNYLPLKKDVAFHLNKLKFSSPKDALCQVWLKLTQWFGGRRFLYFVDVFLLFHNYLPSERETALYFSNNKLESPSLKDALCQVWLKLAQWFFKFRQCIFAIS